MMVREQLSSRPVALGLVPPISAALAVAVSHGETFNFDRGLYDFTIGVILGLMLAWVVEVTQVRKSLHREQRRLRGGIAIGTWINAFFALIASFALRAGLPQYEPLVVFIILATVQAVLAGGSIPLLRERQLSCKMAVSQLALAVLATDAVGSMLAAPSETRHLARAFRSVVDGHHPSMRFLSSELIPFAWLHGETVNLDASLYYSAAAAILAIMLVWLNVAFRARRGLLPKDRRFHAGATMGTWIVVLLALITCGGLGMGLPQYEPLVIFVGLASLQAIITLVGLPLILIWMSNRGDQAGD